MKHKQKNQNFPIELPADWLDFATRVNKFFRNNYKQYNFDADKVLRSIFWNLENNSNDPDRVQTIASKIRSFLYPIFSKEIASRGEDWVKVLNIAQSIGIKFFSKKDKPLLLFKIEEIKKLYSKMSDLDHYCINPQYEEFQRDHSKCQNYSLIDLRKDLETLRSLFPTVENVAIILHEIILAIINKSKKGSPGRIDKDNLNILFNLGAFDAKDYFFDKADERWIDWLWENGFLDEIKQKAEDPTRYSYKTPELNYLVKVAEKVPEKVVDIMLQVQISKETFNPEVIDRFVYICSKLPVKQLVRMILKIRDEKWIPLMSVFNQWGYEYEEMLKKLFEAKNFDNLLILVEAILPVKSREEIKSQNRFPESPFYFENLSYTRVFWYLVNIDDEYLEKALDLSIKILKEVIDNISEKNEENIFQLKDHFYFYEDFVDLKVVENKDLWGKDNIKELIAAILEISRKLIKEKFKDNKEELRKIFKDILDFENVKILPDTYSLWKLRLAILQLDCLTFKDEIQKSLFRIFNVGDRYPIVFTTEYQKLLRDCFGILAEKDKRDYVKQVIEFFVGQKKKNPYKEWIIKYCSKILSLIFNHLTEEEKIKAKENGFELNPDIEIEPEIEVKFGSVRSGSPISYEEFSKMEIKEILEKLITEWTPENLYQTYKDKYDIFDLINAGGIGDYLKRNIPERLEKYLEYATEFFNREKLHPHYTYSFLAGVQEAIKNNRIKAKDIDWSNLIDLLLKIKELGEKKSFYNEPQEQKFGYTLLATWKSVHFAMTDVIRELLKNEDGIVVIDFTKYRSELLKIIKYLLNYPDLTPEDEDIKTAQMTVERVKEKKISDPFTMAINSVRGRAFEDFVLFIYQDGEKLKEDVKEVFKKVLEKENTRALMFMFGYYLPSFYFRDKEWVRNLFSKIFPRKNNRLYTASWQGYLSQNLYKELFFDLEIQKLYEYGITLKEENSDQENFRDLEEGIAIHLALAFVHFKEFDFENKLFKKFWEEGTAKEHFHFVDFIGRHIITREDNLIEKIEKDGLNIKKRIKDFWNWMLEKYTKDKKPFEAFGFWIDLDKEIFKGEELADLIKRTLEKTSGILDWEYALMKNIVRLAQESPENTLEILSLFLNGVLENKRENRMLIHIDQEWYEAFNILYQNPKTKEGVISLINELLEKGGRLFWKLEDIIRE
jgi:hypothetical protein